MSGEERDAQRGRARGGASASRRQFLRTAGMAGAAAVAWTTPQVLSAPAHAQGGSCSCTPATVNLLASPFGNGVNVTSGSYVANGSTLTFTRSNADTINNTTCPGSTPWTSGVITNCTVGNISSGQIPMVRVGNGSPQSWTLTIDFAPAVSQLAFTLTDIDASTNSLVRYREQVTISWTNAVGSALPTYTPGTNLESPATNTYRVNSSTFNAPYNDPSCNLGVEFDCSGTISQLVIQSTDLNGRLGTSSTSGRMVGLAGLSFCVP